MRVKRKGAYEYDYENQDTWHKNFSARVVAKAAEKVLVNGMSADEAVRSHDDLYDFFLRTKVPRSSKLLSHDCLMLDDEHQHQSVSRYYVSVDGVVLTKRMPPLPKSPGLWRNIGINKTEAVTICNDTVDIDVDTIDYSYYIDEVNALTSIFN